MTASEYGFLLLCCDTGSGEKPLTQAQLRQLRQRVRSAPRPIDTLRSVRADDLTALGYDDEQAAHLLRLLSRQTQLDEYLQLGAQKHCLPLCYTDARFPAVLKQKLGALCPAVLFFCGEVSLLQTACISLVGSRSLNACGAAFAARVGQLAAHEKLTLVSGGAVGADSAAARACRLHGGQVIVFPADALYEYSPAQGLLYLSEGGWHLPFSPARALTRNRYIHALGERVLVAQTDYGRGGTWRGTTENLTHGWSPVFVCDDGSAGAKGLVALGAQAVSPDLEHLHTLTPAQTSFLHGQP